MTMTYEWKVTGVKTRDVTNTDGDILPSAVVQTHWEVTGTDEHGHTGMFAGATPFTADNVPAGTFVAFSDLTQDIVLGWIKAVVVGEYWDHVKERIQYEINQQHIQEPDLPWAAAE